MRSNGQRQKLPKRVIKHPMKQQKVGFNMFKLTIEHLTILTKKKTKKFSSRTSLKVLFFLNQRLKFVVFFPLRHFRPRSWRVVGCWWLQAHPHSCPRRSERVGPGVFIELVWEQKMEKNMENLCSVLIFFFSLLMFSSDWTSEVFFFWTDWIVVFNAVVCSRKDVFYCRRILCH